MERQPQRTGALLAAGAAIVLIVSMFLEWYTLDLPERIQDVDANLPTFTAFEGLQRADVAIVVAAGLAIAVAALVVAGVLANSPAPAVALVAAGLFALAVVVYRGVISPPGLALFGVDLELKVSFGWFVSLIAAALIVVGGLVTYIVGPHLQFAADESESTPEKRSTDGASRPLS
jgi:type II secretory pathway component PulM